MTQFLYGKNVVRQLLEDKREIQKIFLVGSNKEMEALAKKNHVTIEVVEKKYLTKLCHSEDHQGIAAEVEQIKTYTVQELLERVPEGEQGLFVMVDELEDPHNLGAILRSCDAVGAHGVIFKKNHSVGLTPTVAKVSAGAINTIPCAEVTNLSRTIEELKKVGYWIIGADMDGQDYRSLKYDFPCVIVIGSEGKGISKLVLKNCDYVVSIPMKGKINSLNASVSAGILLYEVHNKRFPL